MDSEIKQKMTVGICETQPLVVGGLKSLAETSGGFLLLDPARTLDEAMRLTVTACPRAVIIDKALGVSAVMDFLTRMRDRFPTAFVIWGASMTEPEALRFLKAGARGVLRKTAEPGTIIACLESVAGGGTWLEDTLFHHGVRQRGR